MTDKNTRIEKLSNMNKPVPMKLFAAWEVDRTPSNCIPRLCTLTITRLTLLTPVSSDLSSLSLAVKMHSSKRTLRSHEISVPQPNNIINSNNGIGGGGGGGITSSGIGGGVGGGNGIGGSGNAVGSGIGTVGGGGGGGTTILNNTPILETDLDLNFSLQYPHFIKRDGNRLLILLQRRKKYKTRTILGYKTLAEGVIRMDAVLQKSMDMTVELITTSGKSGHQGITIATLRAERVSSIPVDHDNKNNNSVLLTDRVNEYSDEDEEGEFSTGEDNDDGNDGGGGGGGGGGGIGGGGGGRGMAGIIGIGSVSGGGRCLDGSGQGGNGIRSGHGGGGGVGRGGDGGGGGGYDPKRGYASKMRKYGKLHRSENYPDNDDGGLGNNQNIDSDSEFENIKDKGSRSKISRKSFLQQRNFKQRIVALLKRFKVPEELDGQGGNRGPGALRGERDLDALFQELESLSCEGEGDDSGPDMDSLSIGSTPKPSLRPFFTNSRNNLVGVVEQRKPLEKRDSGILDKKTNMMMLMMSPQNTTTTSIITTATMTPTTTVSSTTPEKCGDGKNDSSGNEAGVHPMHFNTPPPMTATTATTIQSMNDPDVLHSDPQNTGSPPRGEKETIGNDIRTRLFRVASGTPGGGASSGKKKQSLSLSAEPIKSILDTCLSPTNVEPRKSLLDQLTRTFSTEEALLPDVVTIIGPPEAFSNVRQTTSTDFNFSMGGILNNNNNNNNNSASNNNNNNSSNINNNSNSINGTTLIQRLAPILATSFRPTFSPHNTAEVKAVLQALMNKIQKYCNTTAKPPTTIKVLLLGGDWLQGAVLRHYVDLLGVRPPDWVNHIRFYIVPIGSSAISRYLSAIDSTYGSLFGSDSWLQLCERTATFDSSQSKFDIIEITNRVQSYLHTAGPCTQIPIAEAMVNYKDEDSCQIFVPFISDVRIGYLEAPQLSLDLDESFSNYMQQHQHQKEHHMLQQQQQQLSSGSLLSNSPPQSGRSSPPPPSIQLQQQQQQQHQLQQQQSSSSLSSSSQQQQQIQLSSIIPTTPHSTFSTMTTVSSPYTPTAMTTISAAVAAAAASSSVTSTSNVITTPPINVGGIDTLELQIDYWPILSKILIENKDKGQTKGADQQSKYSIKSTFRSLQVSRLPLYPQAGDISQGLIVNYATKEKKQKIMRLGKKKEKDRDSEKEQMVEGVARLICSPKQSHPIPLRVFIDGTEWTGVKFFQLSSQWQTHVKNFPVSLIGIPLGSSSVDLS